MTQNARKFGLRLRALILAVLLVGVVALAPIPVSAEDGSGGRVIQDSSGIRIEGSAGGEPVTPAFGSPDGGAILFEQLPTAANASWASYTSDNSSGFRCLDDFWGLTEDIGDIHWYGFSYYECDPTGMEFEIIFYQDFFGAPGAQVAAFSNVTPTIIEYYGTYAGVFPAYRFEVASLGTPVNVTDGWVSIQSTSSPNGCWFLWLNSPTGDGNAIQEGGIISPPPPLEDNLAFALTGWGLEFGDAPEGALAYPSTGVTGAFPTCKNVTVAGWIQHNNFGTWFGPRFDIEPDGNHGLCPGFAPYDNDECFQDGDAGLILPQPCTIQGGAVVPCGNSMGRPLEDTCQWAQWGSDIDILIHNWMPNDEPYLPAYVNVLVDWNQDGQWQNDPATNCSGSVVPEHVLVDFVVPPQYDGTLSALGPPSFQIGPHAGYVWARFSITEAPVGSNWTGEGDFEDGETEDYLLRVYQPPPVGGEAYPVNKASVLAPWIAVAVLLASGTGWYALRRRKTRS
jgi:hypothetical protein